MQLKGTPRRNLHSSWKRFKKWSGHKKGERRIRRTYKTGAKTFSRRSQWPSPLLPPLFSPLYSLLRVCPKQGTAQPKKGKKARLPACLTDVAAVFGLWRRLDFPVSPEAAPQTKRPQSKCDKSRWNTKYTHTHPSTQLRNKQKQRNIKKTDGQRKQLSQWRAKCEMFRL